MYSFMSALYELKEKILNSDEDSKRIFQFNSETAFLKFRFLFSAFWSKFLNIAGLMLIVNVSCMLA